MKKLLLLLFFLAPSVEAARYVATIDALQNDADGCFQTQSAATITLNGALVASGVCVFGEAQKLSVASTADDSGKTFTIVGTNADLQAQTEVLTGPNATTVHSTYYWRTITSVTPSADPTGDIIGGPLSAQGAVSDTIVPSLTYPVEFGVSVDITGTCTYSLEHTLHPMPQTLIPVYKDTLTGKTADDFGSITYPVGGIRARITAYTSGALSVLVLQSK
jgi:hypothetical protein